MGVQDVPREGDSAKIVRFRWSNVVEAPRRLIAAGLVAREREGWRARLWLAEAHERPRIE
jgi:hypothetical protein